MAFDGNNAEDLAMLKVEVDTDPRGYGYVWENTTEGLELINRIREEIVIENSLVLKRDIIGVTYYQAYRSLQNDEQGWYQILFASGNDDQVWINPDVRTLLTGNGEPSQSWWAPGDRDAMVEAMSKILDRPGSRAEEIWGEESIIGRNDWIAAREL